MAGGSPDRNFETIRHQLEGQYHRHHGAGSDVEGVVIVFYRFDDERHVVHDYRRTPVAIHSVG
jgi:hypothetical protein